MPASEKYTLIRLMRGKIESSGAWVPEVGEPLLDMESGTLRFGDAESLGGIPINTVTTVEKECPIDLNEQKVWGRYYFSGEVKNVPYGFDTLGSYFLVVESSTLGGREIWQTLKVLDGNYFGKTYTRMTMDKGITWTDWRDISNGGGYDNAGSGAEKDDTNINNYVLSSETYIEGLINGPQGTAGCNGFLTTKRPDPDSPYIYQQLIIVGCEKYGGRVFYRYSVDGNKTWNAPGYDWKEQTDYVNRDLLNATGILPTVNGGTGRNDGSIAQADHANNADEAKHTLVSDKVGTTNVGSPSMPIYIKNGVATQCGNTLDVNISKNAATADSAGGSSKTTIGSANKPVYLKNGVITQCDETLAVNITKNAATASVADIANRAKYA